MENEIKEEIKKILKESLTSSYDSGTIEDGGISGGDEAIQKLYELQAKYNKLFPPTFTMQEVIAALQKMFEKYVNLERDYEAAMDALVKIEFENKREAINNLRTKRNDADAIMKKYYTAIQALRNVCSHTLDDGSSAFRYKSNDSHYDYEICLVCGFERRT